MPRSTASGGAASPVPGVIPEPTHVSGAAAERSQPQAAEPRAPAAESRGGRYRRKAHRSRLHLYAFGAVALLVYIVALGTSNTGHVKVDWVFGTSSVSLVWLVLFAAVLGWLLGTLITALFRWRTRAPRPS